MTEIRILIADDNPIVRTGLVTLLEAEDLTVAGEARNGREALDLTRRLRPDVVLLDIRMPLLDGLAAVETLSAQATVIMLTNSDSPANVRSSIRRGAAGYLVHGQFDAGQLANEIRSAANGSSTPMSGTAVRALMDTTRSAPTGVDLLRLTRREREVMELMARGLTNGAIAKELTLSEKTVKNHVNHMYAKLGVTKRPEAIARWNEALQEQE
ncbi:response regulator transcription factor [Spiractinospora alimapuensis]|uniref:response regulator n=1 Tax=Spiractinospora alimapuensis TaxID=2820884 RepID=UPI001F254225|nr:response regulator transcription factor [Spiractinospora alimapuensis]QVQ53768.1 response regulator transcription factor [Spiractinospora alimapuensis]